MMSAPSSYPRAHARARTQVEAMNWTIIPLGTVTRYFDTHGSCYRCTFVPMIYLFCKSESTAATAFAKDTLIKKAKDFLDVDIVIVTGGFDASDAFRNGLSATSSYFTDQAHVLRKLKQEQGPRLLKNQENGPFLNSCVNLRCAACTRRASSTRRRESSSPSSRRAARRRSWSTSRGRAPVTSSSRGASGTWARRGSRRTMATTCA